MNVFNLLKARKCLGILLGMAVLGAAHADQTSTATVNAGTTINVASSPLGGLGGCGMVTGIHTYGTAAPFTTAGAGSYTFEVIGGSGTVYGDPFLAVYAGAFDPANPTANLVGCNDDGGGGGVGLNSKFTANLNASTTYVAVAMSYGSGTGNTGTVNFSIGANPVITMGNQTLALGTTGASMTATSTSTGAVTYSSSNPAVATINATTGALTLLAAGTTTITATQAAEASPLLFRAGTRTATLTVTAPAAALSPTSQTVSATAGSPMTATGALNGTGFVGTVSYSVSPALPAGLSLNTSTGVISGTPAAIQGATTYTVTGTGATSGSATATVSIAVVSAAQAVLAVTASPSTLRPGHTSALSTTGGSGTGAVTYSITSGSCTVSGATLTAGATNGSCVVTATKAADGTYSAATGTVTVTVNPSIAQAIDNTVKGTVTAHASTALRFTDAQIRNVTDHMNAVGRGFKLNAGRLALRVRSPVLDKVQEASPVLLAMADNYTRANEPKTMSDAFPPEHQEGDSNSGAKQLRWLLADAGKPGQAGAKEAEETEAQPLYSFWFAGDVSTGKMSVQSSTNHFHSDGLTIGLDYLFADKAIGGLAVGYGNDHTDVDSLGTKIKGEQVSVTIYGVIEPVAGLLVDGQLGYGNLSFHNNRYSALSAALLSSRRKGNSKYAGLGVSLPFAVRDFEIKPYLRANYSDITLDGYGESGDVNALAFARATIRNSSYQAGVLASYDIHQTDGGVWTPMARLEVRRNQSGSLDQAVSFGDTPTDVATVRVTAAPREAQLLGLGVSYRRSKDLTLGVSWTGSQGSNSYRSSGVRAEVVVPF